MKAAKKTDKAVPAASAVPQGPSSYNCCVEDVWYIVVLQNGTFIFKDGSKYEGEYKEVNNVIFRHGEGKFTSKVHETVYTGTWASDKLNGKGRIEYRDGSYYEGLLKDNRYEGQGKFVWPDGSTFVGDFHDNRFARVDSSVVKVVDISAQGSGKYSNTFGEVWLGKFANGVGEGLTQEFN